MIHRVKGFSMVNEAELDAFLKFLCFLYDPMDVGNLISGSSAFYKPSMENCKYYFINIICVYISCTSFFKVTFLKHQGREPSSWQSVKPGKVMEFQRNSLKSWKIMLLTCCTQSASKSGKLSNRHRIGKGRFSLQSQRKPVPKYGELLQCCCCC